MNANYIATLLIAACLIAFSFNSCTRIEISRLELKQQSFNKEINHEQNN
jgi:hypothetical protein